MDLYFPFFYFVFVSCAALLLLLLLCSVKLRSSIRGVQRKTRDLFWAENMILVQNLIMERLRPIVNLKGWDYCVLWKLGDDQRFLEWLDCCCAGSENMIQNGGDQQEFLFPVSSVPPCRDIMFQHPRTKPCDLLANLPFSILLDSGIYAQTLMSNQVSWLNFSNNSDSNALEETAVGTRVLIPVPIGLVELFVAKQVAEDPQTMDFVTSSVEQAMINSSSNMDPSFSSVNVNELMQSSSKAFLAAADDHEISINAQKDDHNLVPYDLSVDRIRLSNVNSSMNFLQQFNNNNNEMSLFEGSNDSFVPDHKKPMNNNSNNVGLIHNHEEGGDSIKQETAAAGRNLESVSDCSDPNIEDELDDHHHGGGGKYRRRTGTEKGQAKNLLAERKRRRKLNDRLYSLRALVPNISKLDRASILGDAIEFVKELQKQVEDLQRELEDQPEDEGAKNTGTGMNGRSDIPNQNGIHPPAGSIPQAVHDHEKAPNGFLKESAKKNHLDSDNTQDKLRQMEPQVEVAQLDGNEFFVKVFCEHKPGSLVRLMTTLNSLGLEVTNVNVTSSRSLVSNVFKVEKRDSEMVQADHVRESLLEITRNPYGW